MAGPTLMPGDGKEPDVQIPRPFTLGRNMTLPPFRGRGPAEVERAAERFTAEMLIGEGGSGTVARVRDEDLGRHVAVKRLKAEFDTPGDVVRFVREVRLMGALEHPNIVPVYDVGKDSNGAYYAIMKYVKGQTLEELLWKLREGDPETHRVWTFEARTRLFMEILRGVNHAHQQGVLHRDIKPGNVMVARDGSVQILDWGLAKSMEETEVDTSGAGSGNSWHTQRGALLGTPAYMAPEQARGEPYTQQTEVFGLGALFWELLTLRSLWREHLSTEEMVETAATRDLPVPFHLRPHAAQGPVPAHLSWFAWRATRPDPGARFGAVQDMIDDLQRRASGVFPAQCPATFQRRTLMGLTRLLDRHPIAFPIVASCSAVVLLGLSFVLGVWVG